MNERIRDLRKNVLCISQKDFAEKLNISENFVWMVEKGARVFSERTLTDICEKFGVDPVWLRTGVGEPMRPISKEEQITQILSQAISGPSTARDRLIRALARLPEDAFPLIEQYVLDAAESILAEKK